MAVTSHAFTNFASQAIQEKVNLGTDTLKVMLLSALTIGDLQDTATYLSDILAEGSECSGTGYTAGGQALTGVTITETDGSHLIAVSCGNPSWAGITVSAAYAVFYDAEPGSSATDPVICYWNFGGTLAPGGATLALVIPSPGFVTFTGS